MNHFELMSKQVEGYSNGYNIDEFKKGETVYYWDKRTPASEPEFISGKVVKIVKERNAAGKDCIRQIHVEITENGYRSFCTVAQIKHFIFKKDIVEIVEPAPEKPAPKKKQEAAPVVEEIEGAEIMWVEKAMSAKNPAVKKLVAEGWEFVTKIWNSEKNMYLAKLQKVAGEV